MSTKILSAGVVVVRQDNEDQWLYLLLRCYDYWDFPKGMVEAGEKPLDAAIREVEEETTISKLNFEWGDKYLETGPYKQGSKIARYYLASTPQINVSLPVNPQLGRAEHEEYRWMTFEAAYDNLSPRVQRVLTWASQILPPAHAQRETVP